MLQSAIRRVLPKNRFVRSVSVLAGGTAAGQAIVIAASPILTRLYSPDDFGLLAVYTGLLSILAVVASLRYQLAIPLPESDDEAASIVAISLLLVILVVATSAVFVAFLGAQISTALNTPALDQFLWLLPLGLILTGFYEVFRYWAIRKSDHRTIAHTKLIQAVSMVGVQLGGHVLGPVALILGQISGRAAGISTVVFSAIRKKPSFFSNVSFSSIRFVALRYRRFPIYSSGAGILCTTGTHLPPLLLATLFSASAAGIYLLAQRVMIAPLQLIGGAIADVFVSDAATANREDRIGDLVSKIHEKLAGFAMPPALIILIIGPDLFQSVFGPNWRQAGEFARWLAPWVYVMFITSPLSNIFYIREKQAQGLVFDSILLATRVLSLMTGAFLGDLILTIALFSLGSAACYGALLLWITVTVDRPWWSSLLPTVKAFAISVLLLTPLLIACILAHEQENWSLIVGLAFSGVLIVLRYINLLRQDW